MFGLEPHQIAVAGMATVFIGIAKAGFGGGIGILTAPMMALVIAPSQTLGILLPILCVCDMVAIWHYRKHVDRRNLTILLPGGLLGIGLGSMALGKFSDEWLGLAIGLLAISFVARQLWLGFRRTDDTPYHPNWVHGSFLGLAAGASSTLAHAGGPITSMFLLPQRLGQARFVGTTAYFFIVINFAKLPPYLSRDVITLQTFQVSLGLVGFVIVGSFLGIWMNSRINETWFNRVVYTLLFFAGGRLIYTNLSGLYGG